MTTWAVLRFKISVERVTDKTEGEDADRTDASTSLLSRRRKPYKPRRKGTQVAEAPRTHTASQKQSCPGPARGDAGRDRRAATERPEGRGDRPSVRSVTRGRPQRGLQPERGHTAEQTRPLTSPKPRTRVFRKKCSGMFTAPLFIIAAKWGQPRFPPAEK